MDNKTNIPEDEDLINRYVYAVMKYLPRKNHVELEKEIRMLISDTVDSVSEQSASKLEAVKIALVKLGTPEQLAAKYSNDTETSLIGGEYYPRYKMLLKIIMSATAFGMTLAMILGAFGSLQNIQEADKVRTWFEIIGTSISSIFTAVCCAFTFVTVGFAIAQRKHMHLENNGTGIDNLPPVPKHDNQISRIQCILSISFIVLFFILFMTAPGFFRMPDGNGNFVPVLNGAYIKKMWLFFALFCLCGIVRDSVKLYELRYSKKLFIVTLVTNVVATISAVFFFSGKESVMSDTYINFMSALQYDNEFIRKVIVNFSLFFLIVIIFALIMDTLETTMKFIKENK